MLEIIALFLTIIALLIAISQIYAASKQAKNINLIHQSLSTRYLEQFPDFLSKTVDLIKAAKVRVEIYVDVPAYGLFSDPKNFIRYKHIIEEKISEGIEVDITFLNDKRRKDIFNELFPIEVKEWEEWKLNPLIKEKIMIFLETQCDGRNLFKSLTSEKLFLNFETVYKRTISTSFRGAKISEIDSSLPMHFWIIDSKEAIFAIPSYKGQKDRTQGFITSDPRLISALYLIKNKPSNI